MDDATKARVAGLLTCPLGQLSVGDAIWLAMTLEGLDDDELAALIP